MLPIAVALACWLWFAFPWQVPALWLTLTGAACVLVACTKVAFLGWGMGILEIDFTGISGHTMLSTAVIPVMFYVALMPAPGTVRALGLLAGLALGALVGLSRLALQAHSVSEVITGCLLGAAVSLTFVHAIREREPQRYAPFLAPLSLLLLTASLHGVRVPTQHWVTQLALTLSGHERPFIRARWKSSPLRDKAELTGLVHNPSLLCAATAITVPLAGLRPVT